MVEERFCCSSTVYSPSDSGILLALASDADGLAIPPGASRELRIEVINTTDASQTISVSASDDERVLTLAEDSGRDDEGFVTELTLPAQGSANLILNASRRDIFADLNGLFTHFIIEAQSGDLPPASLITPIRLGAPTRTNQRRVAIESIRLLPDASQIELTFLVQ